MAIYFMKKNEKKSFVYSMDDYLIYIENNNFSYQVDKIDGYDTAVVVGEKLFVEHFGEDVLKEKPFQAYYDRSSETWMISGNNKIRHNTFGGFAHAIIDENGIVLAIWHDK